MKVPRQQVGRFRYAFVVLCEPVAGKPRCAKVTKFSRVALTRPTDIVAEISYVKSQVRQNDGAQFFELADNIAGAIKMATWSP